ncbi:TMV resistance protein N [Tanacetum coccineum]
MNPSSSSVSPSSSKRKRDDSIFYEEPNCKKAKNDIFMNYSFEDIGQSFISHLRQALSRKSFTISDHTVLPVGQDMRLQLFKAIEESEIYVVVFSTNYASSVRCLDELVHIVDCLGKLEQRKVLPVFYKVDPSDVRSQKGSFMEAFLAHETNVDPERVQNWKQALKDAGSTKNEADTSNEKSYVYYDQINGILNQITTMVIQEAAKPEIVTLRARLEKVLASQRAWRRQG